MVQDTSAAQQDEARLHSCSYEKGPEETTKSYGPAIVSCIEYEYERGKFWVGNDEYCNQVNFCPFCGVKAPVQLPPQEKD